MPLTMLISTKNQIIRGEFLTNTEVKSRQSHISALFPEPHGLHSSEYDLENYNQRPGQVECRRRFEN